MKKETRDELMYDADNQCQWEDCAEPATEAAHRIADTNANAIMCRRLWYELTGKMKSLTWTREHIIDHKFNLAASCSGHNSNFNCGNNPAKAQEIVERIHSLQTAQAAIVICDEILDEEEA